MSVTTIIVALASLLVFEVRAFGGTEVYPGAKLMNPITTSRCTVLKLVDDNKAVVQLEGTLTSFPVDIATLKARCINVSLREPKRSAHEIASLNAPAHGERLARNNRPTSPAGNLIQ